MLPLLTICFSINYFSQVPPHKEYNYLCDMKLLHSIFFGLILLASIPQMVTAQTIIPLERGKGGVQHFENGCNQSGPGQTPGPPLMLDHAVIWTC